MKFLKNTKGFTLIELLVVIAVLGTLAVVVLIAINPVQQLARTRDAGRASSVTQLGHGIEAYATVNNGVYPVDGAGCALANVWATNCLVTPGEIQTVPSQVLYSSLAATPGTCGGVTQNGWCYDATSTAAVVYAAAEATSNTSKCTAGQTGYYVFSSAAGRGGLWCGAAAPTPGLLGSSTGWVN